MTPVSFGREVASVALKVVAVLVTIFVLVFSVIILSAGYGSVSDGSCNIAVMPIEGIILPFGNGSDYAEFAVTPNDVSSFLASVDEDMTGAIEGVLFEVNSPGGTPVAAERITKEIKAIDLPTAALIGDMGASGGYMVASAADRIFASAMSDVGSIGVTMSYVENSIKNEEEGLTYVPLNTGKFKDTGSPDKPLSGDERTYLEGQLNYIHDEFISLVAGNRNMSFDEVKALADGSTYVGKKAVENKLIDEIGDRDTVKQYFATMLNKDISEIIFCEYVPPLDLY